MGCLSATESGPVCLFVYTEINALQQRAADTSRFLECNHKMFMNSISTKHRDGERAMAWTIPI